MGCAKTRWAPGRQPAAPAFLTVYPSTLLLLNLVLPDLLAAANKRLAALGASRGLRPIDLVTVIVAGRAFRPADGRATGPVGWLPSLMTGVWT